MSSNAQPVKREEEKKVGASAQQSSTIKPSNGHKETVKESKSKSSVASSRSTRGVSRQPSSSKLSDGDKTVMETGSIPSARASSANPGAPTQSSGAEKLNGGKKANDKQTKTSSSATTSSSTCGASTQKKPTKPPSGDNNAKINNTTPLATSPPGTDRPGSTRASISAQTAAAPSQTTTPTSPASEFTCDCMTCLMPGSRSPFEPTFGTILPEMMSSERVANILGADPAHFATVRKEVQSQLRGNPVMWNMHALVSDVLSDDHLRSAPVVVTVTSSPGGVGDKLSEMMSLSHALAEAAPFVGEHEAAVHIHIGFQGWALATGRPLGHKLANHSDTFFKILPQLLDEHRIKHVFLFDNRALGLYPSQLLSKLKSPRGGQTVVPLTIAEIRLGGTGMYESTDGHNRYHIPNAADPELLARVQRLETHLAAQNAARQYFDAYNKVLGAGNWSSPEDGELQLQVGTVNAFLGRYLTRMARESER